MRTTCPARSSAWAAILAAICVAWVLGAAPSAQPRAVTFSGEVAPIIYSHCSSCHRPDGPAPFALVSYDDVRSHAREIAAATASRRMPPWKPDAGYGDFVGDRRLSDEQIAILQR